MVTGASTADLAVILIDARKGVLVQTRRHCYLAHLLGIRNIVLAVNKMDLVGYDQAMFDAIVADYRRVRRQRSASTAFTAIPISGFKGDNITAPLGQHAVVRRAEPDRASRDGRARQRRRRRRRPFRMPVQWVNRPNLDFRGFAGLIAERHGQAGRCGARAALGQDQHGRRASSRFDGDLDEAVAGQSVTLTLADEIDCSRGDVHRRRRRPAAGRRPVRGDDGLDGRRARCIAGPRLLAQAGDADRVSATVAAAEVRGQRQHDGAPRGQDAGAQRDRRGRAHHRQADRVRALCRQPRRSAASS